MSDPWDSPDAQEWIAHVRKTLLPMLDESAICAVLGPDVGSVDVKIAVELGAMILMEKPILVIALPGRRVPDKLRMVADDIVYADPMSEDGQRQIQEAITAIHERLG